MNRRVAVLALAALPFVAPIAQGAGSWITVERHGIDAAGRSGMESYEIFPDGRAVWRSASLGQRVDSGCGAGGGAFEGRLDAKSISELEGLAASALREQKSPKRGAAPEPRKPRELRWTVSLQSGEKYLATEIRESTPGWKRLWERLMVLRVELRPKAAVSMSAKSDGKDVVEIRFTAPGSDPIEIHLPADASEAFGMEGYRVRYAKKPEQHSLVLGPGLSRASVRLRLDRVADLKESRVLRYSNALVLHHEDREPMSEQPAAAKLNLCAPVR